MKLIAEIYEPTFKYEEELLYRLRKAARSIVTRGNKIALIHVKNKGFYKLPGGGIDEGENIMEALERELIEELGCKVKVIEEIGMTIEFRGSMKLLQISYAFVGEFIKDLGTVSYTEKEITEGCEFLWINVNKALELIEKSKPIDQSGWFIVERDLKILKSYMKL